MPVFKNKTHLDQTSAKNSKHATYPRSVFNLLKSRLHTISLFYATSAIFQILIGFFVTAISILNLIKPLWLSGIMSLLGCIVAMVGIYQFYDVFKSTRSTKDLARDAIERAIRERN